MRVELFTDNQGIELLKLGRPFTAWSEDSKTYEQSEKNIKITVDYKDIEKYSMYEEEYNVVKVDSVNVELKYKYTVAYSYGAVGNSVGCYTPYQAKEIAEAIALRVKTTIGDNAEIVIVDNESGESEKCYF